MVLIPQIALSYDKDDDDSARKIAFAVNPSWKSGGKDNIKVKAFNKGITNTMLKISNPADRDSMPIVLRAFGSGADPLTSRPREIALHAMLSKHGLAPELLARFENGMVYAFAPGEPCDVSRLHETRVWKGVASILGKWHAILPVGLKGIKIDGDLPPQNDNERVGIDEAKNESDQQSRKDRSEEIPGDIWAVMRTWASRLPESNDVEKKRKSELRDEVEWAFDRLASLRGLNDQKLVCGHCDLLAGNVLVQDEENSKEVRNKRSAEDRDFASIQLIDFEYSVACPAAFDIALHFGEWAGFECDYGKIPDRKTRKSFIREYVRSWNENRRPLGEAPSANNQAEEVELMEDLVNRFRGLPGLWFALWGFVQIHDSSEDFDYGKYAETRLNAEYRVWKDWEIKERPVSSSSSKDSGQASTQGNDTIGAGERETRWWQ